MTSLHLDVNYSQTEAAKYLLESGAGPDARSENWNTPLFLAWQNSEMRALFESYAYEVQE